MRNLKGQMVGFHHQCIEYSSYQFEEYYEFLKEADEFGAAAGAYPDERDELIANAAHRYQLLLDWMSQRLELNVAFLNQGKIWFNFYADIATRFGLGTQAYTTETKKPHVGVSEISLQDLYLLQLILLHEMQHAIDFANYAGLQMSISERELRARMSVCEGLQPLKHHNEKLYANSIQDLSYWFVLFFLTDGVDDEKKKLYYDLMTPDAKYMLSKESRGILFSPLVMRALSKELQRDRITISSMERYAVELINGNLRFVRLPIEPGEEPAEATPDLLESLMMADDDLAPSTFKPQTLTKDDISALTVDYSREILTTKNKVMDWQAYDQNYEKLKEQALVAIERDQKSFEGVQHRLDKGSDHTLNRQLFPQVEEIAQTIELQPSEPATLDNIELPEAVQETQHNEEDQTEGAIPVQLEPLQAGLRQRHNIGEDELTLQDKMSDLSEFVKEKGGRK